MATPRFGRSKASGTSPAQQEINDLLVLNRYGRTMVASRAAAVSLERGGDVLMRISNADCSYFVTERVRAALSGPGPAGRRE
jgi:hypothetical protein